jgi:hypothetical protein
VNILKIYINKLKKKKNLLSKGLDDVEGEECAGDGKEDLARERGRRGRESPMGAITEALRVLGQLAGAHGLGPGGLHLDNGRGHASLGMGPVAPRLVGARLGDQ